MIDQLRYIWQLLVLSSILLLLGILLLPAAQGELTLEHYMFTLGAFTLINYLAWLGMSLGIRKRTRDGALILLAGIAIKFLLYLLYILLFWLFTKNLTKAFILAFFTLYLVFTFFTGFSVRKYLKDK
jgi:hypothetical protein